jgi:hypothetical protein
MRAINNIVDATNYLMLEIGQPLHAFDWEKIAGGRIVVRRAGADREFLTLDGIKRELNPNDLMIADGSGPIAIAGVMGGQNSEVGETTKSILLESAYFEPLTIAKTSRRLGLRSEASYRFERGVDRGGQVIALQRASALIGQIANGRAAGEARDLEPRSVERRDIALDLDRMGALLGVDFGPLETKRRLIALGVAPRRLERRFRSSGGGRTNHGLGGDSGATASANYSSGHRRPAPEIFQIGARGAERMRADRDQDNRFRRAVGQREIPRTRIVRAGDRDQPAIGGTQRDAAQFDSGVGRRFAVQSESPGHSVPRLRDGQDLRRQERSSGRA